MHLIQRIVIHAGDVQTINRNNMIVKTYVNDQGLVVYEFTVNSSKEMRKHRWNEHFLNEYDWVEMSASRRRFIFWGPFVITIKWCKANVAQYYKLDEFMDKHFHEN